jgi:glycerol-3-phosphate acyltransferase PlsY
MLAIWPPLALVGAAILLVVVLRTRYMSLGSILGACGIWTAIAIVTVFYNYSPVYLVYGLIATFLIIWQHRDNIQRLAAGTERRIGLTANRDPR